MNGIRSLSAGTHAGNLPFVVLVLSVVVDGLAGQSILVDFDNIPPGPIGTSYLTTLGVEFLVGNGSVGTSTGPALIAGQPVSAYAGNFNTSVSLPNVMVPGPGSNDDIWVRFYGRTGRIAASAVGVRNDAQGLPSTIYLEAFDQGGVSVGVVPITGAGVYGSVAAANIWEVRISGAPGLPGLLGVDDFRFTRAIGGSVASLPHACGPLAISHVGGFALGDTFTAVVTGASGVPVVGFGVSPGAVAFCSCTIGHEWAVASVGPSSSISIPNAVAFLGFIFAAQGADFLGAGGCASPMIGLSDTLVVTVG